MVIINSVQAAKDLLDKRSVLYSDRPRLESAAIIGYTNTLPMVSYGDRLREQRRMLNKTMGSRALVEGYGALEEREAHYLLQRILENPSCDKLLDHIKRFAFSQLSATWCS